MKNRMAAVQWMQHGKKYMREKQKSEDSKTRKRKRKMRRRGADQSTPEIASSSFGRGMRFNKFEWIMLNFFSCNSVQCRKGKVYFLFFDWRNPHRRMADSPQPGKEEEKGGRWRKIKSVGEEREKEGRRRSRRVRKEYSLLFFVPKPSNVCLPVCVSTHFILPLCEQTS